ncbi:MAG: acetyl-CoA carboxylase biotin carboxyl carrier protein subunit [Acidobacteria bacterium]|nr:acetyl-CoA carboxylase biotin carboxyl carrier protein subunit [Acidobacteriota bacterium]
MTLNLTLDGREISLEIEISRDSLSMKVGDQRVEVRVDSLGAEGLCLWIGRRTYPVTVTRGSEDSTWNAQVRGRDYQVVIPERGLRPGPRPASREDVHRLTARMPGKVSRVLLSVGDQVRAHQGVVVVEAMKMQNEVRALTDGVVREIFVVAGQTVNAGDPLALIEPRPPSNAVESSAGKGS